MRIVLPQYKILTPENRFKEDLKIIEQAGRTCYLSNNVNVDNNEEVTNRFIRSRIKEGHEAIIEFSNITVQFCVDRGVTHELVRHRLCSFAQESSRYCNYANNKAGNQITVVLPSQFIDSDSIEYITEDTEDGLKEVFFSNDHKDFEFTAWLKSCQESEDTYMKLLKEGVQPQRARSVLPTSTKAIINMGANFREWRNVMKLRADKKHVHPDMYYIMDKLLREFKEKVPVIFDDIYPEDV